MYVRADFPFILPVIVSFGADAQKRDESLRRYRRSVISILYCSSLRTGWKGTLERMQLRTERILIERHVGPVRHGSTWQLRPRGVVQKLENVSVPRHFRAFTLSHDFHDDADHAGDVAHRPGGSEICRSGNTGIAPEDRGLIEVSGFRFSRHFHDTHVIFSSFFYRAYSAPFPGHRSLVDCWTLPAYFHKETPLREVRHISHVALCNK